MVKLTRLKEVRERRALSQRELAERSGVGSATIARLETFVSEPRPTTVRKLAAALRVKVDTLMAPVTSTDTEGTR